MNTKTMRLPPRRVLTSGANATATTNKRKEREDQFERPKPITPTATTSKLLKLDRPTPRPSSEPITTASSESRGLDPTITTTTTSNQLLAGYLAHEYLTKGTLMGQPWVPPRVEGTVVEEKRKGKTAEEDGGAEAAAFCRRTAEERERYVEVAGLLKGGGSHLSGVVNPSQLARFLHL